jgi:O-antigen ligase
MRPKWGLYALVPIIGLGFSDASAVKGGMVALVATGFLIHFLVHRGRLRWRQEVVSLVLVVLGLIVWVAFRGLFGGEGIGFWFFWVIKRLFATSVVALLVLLSIETQEDAWTFAKIIIGFAVITALIGILQYVPGWQIFWSAREVLGVPNDIAYQIFGKVRITGVAAFVIPFAYQLLSIFPVALTWCVVAARRKGGMLVPLLGTFIIFTALVLTFVKAAIGGAIIGGMVALALLVPHYLSRQRFMRLMAGALLAAGLVTLLVPAVRSNVFRLGDSSYERIPIALAAVQVLAANPLGSGYDYNRRVAEIYDTISDRPGAELALVQFPHNILLGIGVILGIPALVFVFLFYLLVFRGLYRIRTEGSPDLQLLAIGLLGSFVAYVINACFHNNNPFFGDTFNWMLIGLVLAVMNLVAKREVY